MNAASAFERGATSRVRSCASKRTGIRKAAKTARRRSCVDNADRASIWNTTDGAAAKSRMAETRPRVVMCEFREWSPSGARWLRPMPRYRPMPRQRRGAHYSKPVFWPGHSEMPPPPSRTVGEAPGALIGRLRAGNGAAMVARAWQRWPRKKQERPAPGRDRSLISRTSSRLNGIALGATWRAAIALASHY